MYQQYLFMNICSLLLIVSMLHIGVWGIRQMGVCLNLKVFDTTKSNKGNYKKPYENSETHL